MKNYQLIGETGVYIIAEMACAHEGNPEFAYHLVEVVSESKPDAIQLQIFSAERLISPISSKFGDVKKLEIQFSDWKAIINSAQKKVNHVWANVFDERALEFVLSEDIDGIKLHSSDLSNPRMLDAVGVSGKPISIAVGGSTLDEISSAVAHLEGCGAQEIVLMHGYQGYPTEIADVNLSYINKLEQKFGFQVGYQDHTDGGSDLAFLIPLLAVGAGAQYIEKHFTDDRSKKGIDYEAALDPADFRRFVNMIRAISPALIGKPDDFMSEAEKKYRQTMKKKIVAGRDLKKGEKIESTDLIFLRADSGLTSSDYLRVIGLYCMRDIEKYSAIHGEDISFQKP